MNSQSFQQGRFPLSILCAIDFSDSSQHALNWSVDMAARLQAHITVLYTFRLLKAGHAEALMTKKKMEEEALTRFARLERELLTNKTLSYDFRSEVGFVADRVEDHIRRQPVHLVVVGKEMAGIDNHEILEELIAQTRVPLVIVP